MNNHPTVTELTFQTDPIHLFEHDGKIAFIAQEIAKVLGIANPTQSLAQSKALEQGVDYDVLPPSVLPETHNLLVSNTSRVTILYDSGFFLFVIRSNKDVAIPFIRWAIREAIPQAFQKLQVPELSQKTLVDLVKEERQGSAIARAMLAAHGWIDPNAPVQLTTVSEGSHE